MEVLVFILFILTFVNCAENIPTYIDFSSCVEKCLLIMEIIEIFLSEETKNVQTLMCLNIIMQTFTKVCINCIFGPD